MGGEASMKAAVLTVSDRAVLEKIESTGGLAAIRRLEEAGHDVVSQKVVRDEFEAVAKALREFTQPAAGIDIVITVGGTGLSPRSVTPEATLSVLDRTLAGIPEELRRSGLKKIPNALLFRGAAGVRGTTLIVNLPDDPAVVEDGINILLPVLDYAYAILHGRLNP
jgi:molybdenum cofactor synthesis domain-containing protein